MNDRRADLRFPEVIGTLYFAFLVVGAVGGLILGLAAILGLI